MKKASLLLCILILTIIMAAACALQPTPVVSGPQALHASGLDTVNVTMMLNVPAMAGMQAQLKWDPQVFRLPETPAFDAAFKNGAMISMLNPEEAEGTLTMVYLRQKDAAFENTVVVQFPLEVLPTAPAGETRLEICDLQLTNAAVEPVAATAENAALLIAAPGESLATASPEPSAEPEVPAETPNVYLLLEVVPAAVPLTPAPTETPSAVPTAEPTPAPTEQPTAEPTAAPLPSEAPATGEPSAPPAGTPLPLVTPALYILETIPPLSGVGDAQETPAVTAAPTPVPAITEAPTQEPAATPSPTPTPQPTHTPLPAITSTPVPTNTPPSSHTSGSIGSGTTATPTPTQAPSPTPVTLPGESAPAPADGSVLALRTRRTVNGFAVELYADGMVTGGMQAAIVYDPAAAALLSCGFSKPFEEKAIMCMVNDQTPGRLSLVYSSMEGYPADGGTLFTAEFRMLGSQPVQLSLEDVKCTDASAQLNSWSYAAQHYQIQPMDDLTPDPDAAIETLAIAAGDTFTRMLNAGQAVLLVPEEGLLLESSRPEIVSIAADGLAEALQSGASLITAKDPATGLVVAQGTLCVRDALLGLPVQPLNADVYVNGRAAFGLVTGGTGSEAYAARGIRLIFRPAEGSEVVLDGLLPETVTVIPTEAFAGCGSLTAIELHGTGITGIEANAFAGCPMLESVLLSASVTDLAENALCTGQAYTLFVPAESAAHTYAAETEPALVSLEVINE